MSTLDIYDDPSVAAAKAAPSKVNFGAAFKGLWQAWRRRQAERRTLARLQHLDAHVLIDMGFEPAEIYASRVGTWREEHGDAWKGLK